MLNKDKISEAVDFILKKHGGIRPASVATGINAKSLIDYKDKQSEPRNKNLEVLARESRKTISYFMEMNENVPAPEWLLPNAPIDDDLNADIEMLKTIHEAGPEFKKAIQENLKTFVRAIEIKEENHSMKTTLENVMARLEALEHALKPSEAKAVIVSKTNGS